MAAASGVSGWGPLSLDKPPGLLVDSPILQRGREQPQQAGAQQSQPADSDVTINGDTLVTIG